MAAAEAHVERALALSGAQDLGTLGKQFLDAENYAAASAPLRLALRADSTDWETALILGSIALRVDGDIATAVSTYLRAYRHMPDGPDRETVRDWLQDR